VNALSQTGTAAQKPSTPDLNHIFYTESDTKKTFVGVDGAWVQVGRNLTVRKNSGADVGTRPRLNLIEGTNIGLTVADDAVDDEVDVTMTGRVTVRKNTGANVGSRPRLNLIEGSNITLTVADDTPDDEIDVTVAAAGGGLTGSGVANQVAFWTGATSLGGDTALTYNATTDTLTAAIISDIRIVDNVKFTTIQQAIDNLPAAGGIVYVPQGTYAITAAISITKPLILMGAGPQTTEITTTSATIDMLSIATTAPVCIRDIRIRKTVTATAGAGIRVAGSGADWNQDSRITNVRIESQWDGLDFQDASAWTVSDCLILEWRNFGIRVRNTLSPDSGDSTIYGNLLSSAVAGAVGIQQESSGGLRIVSNKIIGHAIGYRLNVATGVSTSVLLISANSIENQVDRCIQLTRTGTGAFSQISITGNQLGTASTLIEVLGGAGGISRLAITGNTLQLAASGNGILLTNGDDVGISANVFLGAASTTGVSVGAGAANVKIGRNTFASVTTDVSLPSGTNAHHVDPIIQRGTETITTSTLANYGTFFSGDATVTFPFAFQAAPQVFLTAENDANGALCGVVKSAPSTTSVAIKGIGITANVAITIHWEAVGTRLRGD
jgi:hypothetical protein